MAESGDTEMKEPDPQQNGSTENGTTESTNNDDR